MKGFGKIFFSIALLFLTVTISIAQGKRCLFVSATATTGTSSEAGIIQKLKEWGYTVTVVATSTLSSTNFSNYDFCFASESVNSSNLTALKGHPIPLVATEAWASRSGVLNWSNPASAVNIVPEPIVIVDSTNHPLSAGFAKGTTVSIVAPQTSVGLITTVPTISVIPIAVSSSNPIKRIVYGIERDTRLTDGSKALNRAACIGIHESGFNGITTDGYKFIKAAIDWVCIPPPTLTVQPASLSFGNIAINTNSNEKTYTISGVSLLPAEGNITISASAGFQVSASSGGGFSDTVIIPYTNGVLEEKTIYVRFVPTEVKNYSGIIKNEGGSAALSNVVVIGNGISSAIPSIFLSHQSLSFGAIIVNTISREKKFSISGSYLTPSEGNIIVTATDGFQVSTESISGFSGTIQLPYTNGTLLEKMISVRFNPNTVKEYSGNITIEGGGVSAINIVTTGSGVSNEPPSFVVDGFAQNTTGGTGGTEVTVTNATDFKTYVTSSSKYIVNVAASMSVGSINVASNKTVRGINSNIVITGCLRINRANNVIIRNLTIKNPSGEGSGDGIEITESTNVLVNHCTFIDCADGMLDVVRGSNYVTISWCRFRYEKQTTHRNVCLFGNSDSETSDMGKLHITMHHCWFDQNCEERLPSVRYGTVHIYNSYYSSAMAKYGVRTRLHAQCLVENNYFENCQNPWELLTTIGQPNGKLRAKGNNVEFMDTSYGNKWVEGWYSYSNGTTVLIPGTDSVFTPPYSYTLESPEVAKARVMLYAGNTNIITSIANTQSSTSSIISDFELLQNFPNPFNPNTNIEFRIANSSFVTLKVYDVLGQEIAELVNGVKGPGVHTVQFKTDDLKSEISSGIYFYKLTVGNFTAVKKMLLVR